MMINSRKSLSFYELQNVLEKHIHDSYLIDKVNQMITFFRLIDSEMEFVLEQKNNKKQELALYVNGQKSYFFSISFTIDEDDNCNKIDILSTNYDYLQNKFLINENKKFVSRRLGGICLTNNHKLEHYNKFVHDVFDDLQKTICK